MKTDNALHMCNECGEYYLTGQTCGVCDKSKHDGPKIIRHDNHELPAMPVVFWHDGVEHAYLGLTKREYIAARAMQGIISDGGSNPEAVAIGAVKYADALLKALEARP